VSFSIGFEVSDLSAPSDQSDNAGKLLIIDVLLHGGRNTLKSLAGEADFLRFGRWESLPVNREADHGKSYRQCNL
jgi:hypothetical protein